MNRLRGNPARRCWAALGVVGLLALAGCGGSASPKTTSAPQAAKPAAAKPAAAKPAAPAQAPAPSSGSAKVKTLVVATPAPTPDFSYLKLANDLGYLKPYHLKLQVESMKPPTALAALESGKIAFVTVIGSSIDAAMHNFPVRVVFIAMNSPDWLLVGGKNIKSIAQLRGKTVGGNVTPNDTVTVTTEEVLKDHGLPQSSYTLRLLGQSSPAVHFAALQSGAVQAVMLDIQFANKAKAAGFPVLARYWPAIQLPNDGIVASTNEIKNDPAMVEHVLAAASKTVSILHSDPTKVLPYLEKDYHMTPAAAKSYFSLIQSVWTTNGLPTNQAIANQMKFVQKELKLKTTPKASQAYDLSLLQKVLGKTG